MKIGSVEGMVQASQTMKDANNAQSRQISVQKKMQDGQEEAMSKLLANSFNGVGQIVNKAL